MTHNTAEAERQAQELIYDAWEKNDKKGMIALARKALGIFPDCADAWNILAGEVAKLPVEARLYYEKGVEAGRRVLGDEYFKKNKGYLWGDLRSRPYMRARFGLMLTLWQTGEQDAAIRHAKAMLRLNCMDNQGSRYFLISCYAELGRFDELEKFMEKRRYRDDCKAEWHYTRVLLFFVKHGDSEKTRAMLKEAFKHNKYVPVYLTGRKQIPAVMPESVTLGGENEGYYYASEYYKAWNKTPGAIQWLKSQCGFVLDT